MSRVLVTGASGFIGRHVAAALAHDGDEVHATAHSSAAEIPGVRWHACDLLDPRATDDLVRRLAPQRLVHVAWYAKPRVCWESPANLDWTQASLHLLRRFAAYGGQRAVFVGSVFEYDWSEGICREGATPLRPQTLYGHCKAALSQLVEAAAPALGVETAWGRVFWLYGPHEPANRLVSSVIEGLARRERVAVTTGTQRRDYSHVGDVAAALAALTHSAVTGPVNIGSGDAVPVRTIVDHLAAALRAPELVAVGARQEAAPEAPLVLADVTRLRREVGFTPRYDLAIGLQDTIEWFARRPTLEPV